MCAFFSSSSRCCRSTGCGGCWGSIDRLDPFCELVLVGDQLAVDIDSHSVAEIPAATCDLLAAIRDAGLLVSCHRRLPNLTPSQLDSNPFPIDVGPANAGTDSRSKLPELFAATTALAMIREPAFIILTALQDLDLPALVLVKILNAAFPNSIPIHKKWKFVVAIKHF